jgi:hypothetical protein
MDPEILFSTAGVVVLVGWLTLIATLILVPRTPAPARIIVVSVALALSMLYAALIGAFWTQREGGFGSLSDVAALFGHPWLLLAGWVHYLAFDLLVGLWEHEEAARIGMSRWLLVPCLLLTFLFGPAGWLVFMAARHFRMQRIGGSGWSDVTRDAEAPPGMRAAP